MKKLFTTILMMGVALCSWASYTAEYDDGTKILTVNYVDDGNSNLNVNDLIKEHMRKAETLVLTGDWANKDLSTIGNLVGRLIKTDGPDANPNKKVFLDLSACSNMRSKVVKTDGTYNADIDWVTTAHKFLPDPNNPETVTITGTATKVAKFYESWGAEYTGDTSSLEQHDDGLWYEPNTSWNGKTKKEVFVDEKGNELTDVTENPDGTFSYSYTKTLDSSVFKFSDGNFYNNENYIGGIAFPNHADFNYIPEGFSTAKLKTSLSSVTFGDYIEWIGQEAFSGCTALTDPVFPATMKVFAGDCFKECNSFTKVDLSVLPKIQIVDYMAFGSTGDNTATSNLAEFILPTSDNTSLKYFANYVIRGTKVKKLDFTHCKGIVNFAHDGKATFGEFSANWDSYWTFYGSSELEEVILPPNLSYLTAKAFNTCPKLKSVTFLGDAVYDKSTCVEGGTNTITNPLIIDEEAFNKDYTLETVVFCNRITEIRSCAFQNTGLTSVSIPASVEVIGVRAFSECTALTTVTFEDIDEDCAPCKHAKTVIAGEHRKINPETGEYVYTDQQATDPNTGELLYDDNGNPIMEIAREGDGDGAFFNCKNITDVYINAPDAEIICENKAFDYDISFGQTNPDASFATLHYPEGEEEKYVNLKHYLTDEIANTPGLFQAWLQAHYNFATKPNNNGWHEFINSGPSSNTDEPPYEDGDVILRTYSDHYARIVPNGIKAYIVRNVALNDDGNYELTLQSLRVIPAETGVILYGQPNANAQGGGMTLSMTAVQYAPDNGYPLRRDYWDMLADELTQDQRQNGLTEPDAVRMKNYLMPIIDNGKIRNATTEGVFSEDDLEDADLQTVLPYEKENGQVTFRNFALNRFNTTKNLSKKDEFKDLAADDANYAGFFRILKGTYASGYAYLHLTSSEYDDPEGAECLVIKDDLYTYEYKGSSFIDFSEKTSLEDNPNRYWQYAVWEGKIKDWGVRNPTIFNLPKPGTGSVVKYLGEVEEEADGIVKLVVPANESGDFFNLQGVKVTNPTKGVYVRNGKKVIIK